MSGERCSSQLRPGLSMETRLNLLFYLNRPHFNIFERNLEVACATSK